jgi:hypothetical protein
MKEIAKHEFECTVVKETACGVVANYGVCKNEAVLYDVSDSTDDEPDLMIEWCVYDDNDDMIEVENIGFEYYDDGNGYLAVHGYDGVFSLSDQLKPLLDKAQIKYDSDLFD